MDNLEKYLKDQGLNNYGSLEYERINGKTTYFFNVRQLEYVVYYISLDTTTATPEDFNTLEQIKSYLQKIGYKFREHATLYYITIDAMSKKDYDALELYNSWTNTSVREYEHLQHKYYTWSIKHPEQFNNHIKTIMDYYGNLYRAERTDQLLAPLKSKINQDFAPDYEDLIF